MPYLASNQDVKEQNLWGYALAGAGLVLGAAAIGGAMSQRKLTKSMKQRYTKGDVVKDLYGKSAKDVYISKEGWDNLGARNFKMENRKVVDQATGETKKVWDFANGTNRYNAGKTLTGKPKMVRTDGNFIQNAWTNYTDKDLRMFNKELKDIYKGKTTGADDIYSKSKLSLYQHLNESSKSLNTNTKELGKLVDDIYGSKANTKIRNVGMPPGQSGGVASDIDITNKVWGEQFGNASTFNTDNYQEAIRPSRSRKKAKGSRTTTVPQPTEG